MWFAEHERLISTPLLALAPLFGAILGQGISPLVVGDDPAMIPYLNIGTISLVTVGTALSWIFMKTAEPLTPPSRSAALLKDQPPMTLKEVFHDAKKVKFIFTQVCKCNEQSVLFRLSEVTNLMIR